MHTGKFMGAPATNKSLSIGGSFIRKIAGDRVVQEWQTTDLLGTKTQMASGPCWTIRSSACCSSPA